MKKCCTCKIGKDQINFHKTKSYKDGFYPVCKQCRKIKAATYYINNREKILLKNLQWEKDNPEQAKVRYKKFWKSEKGKLIMKKYNQTHAELLQKKRMKNSDRTKLKSSVWAKENRDRCNAKWAKRHADKLNATPKWLTGEQLEQINEFYKKAAMMTKFYGVKYEVDHIDPLKGKDSCGLHVPWNLQILTMTENRIKNNRKVNKAA